MGETLRLATRREGQARTLTIAGGADPDRGHWYSPAYVLEYTESLRAEVERLRARQQWQPIETLPPMEVPVWLYENGDIYIGMRADSGEGWLWSKCYSIPWYNTKDGWTEGDPEEDDNYRPTHWMPLPEPPTERGEGKRVRLIVEG